MPFIGTIWVHRHVAHIWNVKTVTQIESTHKWLLHVLQAQNTQIHTHALPTLYGVGWKQALFSCETTLHYTWFVLCFWIDL